VEKAKQRHTKYIGISANESFLLSTIRARDLPVFGVMEIISLCGWGRSRTYNTLVSLERKGILTRIKRNNYAVTDELAKNIFRIAAEAVKPSYISFWTALSHYGFTEQQVMIIQLVSTRQVAGFSAGPFKLEIVKFKPSRFYGYKKMDGFVIAEPEKALVDSLARPDLCGGIGEFAKCLRNAWPGLDKKKFTEYLIRFKNKSIVSRAGHLIERMGLDYEQIDALLNFKSPGFVRLDPGAKKTGVYDRKWNVIVNSDIGREEIT
jgi:predicted transcriptional regulator of viral defense system